MDGKPSTKLFYKIGEVCRLTDIKPHILRYWESEFSALKPRKSTGGQRVYQQKDLDTVMLIKRMLYEDGFTIAGARKMLSDRKAGPGGINRSGKDADGGGAASSVNDNYAGPCDAQCGAPNDQLADALGRFKKEIKDLLNFMQ